MGPKIGGFLALIGAVSFIIFAIMAKVVSDSTSLLYNSENPVSVSFIILGTASMTLLVAAAGVLLCSMD